MNNEPVAWMQVYYKDGTPTKFSKVKTWEDDIPLYTHPVKTLTEPSVKEITDLWLYVVNNIPANDKRPVEWHFANAILRKAQEK
jgi:hypothetical protein